VVSLYQLQVFAPNLIRPKDEKYEQIVNDSSHVLALVHSLLTDHGRFFPAGSAGTHLSGLRERNL